MLCGAASALFLFLLAAATGRFANTPELLWALPFGGAAVALVYGWLGKGLEKGNNLLLERIHDPHAPIPFRLAPLILFSTVVTHLFGGSAGREGTAVQMGGAMSTLIAEPLKLGRRDRRILLMAGIAGGFGSVFGTPLAGAIFAMEVLTVGHLDYEALVPCLIAGFIGDLVCRGLGVHHESYQAVVGAIPSMNFGFFGLLLVAGALFALASVAFSELTHGIERAAKSITSHAWLRPVLGGVLVVGLTYAVGTRDYNGLGLHLIQSSFTAEVVLYAFLLKLVFTSVTLGSGMKGGEVTPLFCIGATLGNAFAQLCGQPPALFAALGFSAVFGAAANTPIACTILGIELFGSAMAMPLAITCIVAYILSGHRGIYAAQRLGTAKSHLVGTEAPTLGEVRETGIAVRFPKLWKRNQEG